MSVSPYECECESERDRERERERERERVRERERDCDVYVRPKKQRMAWYGICLDRIQIWIQMFREN